MDADHKQLKLIGCLEDGGKKRVPVSIDHRDKRYSENVTSILIQFDTRGVELSKIAWFLHWRSNLTRQNKLYNTFNIIKI